jgi:hypothetical protein
MPSKKISQLTAAGPLTGTEPLPIVQGGVTVKTTTFDVSLLGGSPLFITDTIYFGGTTLSAIGYEDDYVTDNIGFKYSQILAPLLTNVVYNVYLQFDSFIPSLLTPITVVENISFPLLETVGVGNRNYYQLYIRDAPLLESINLSSLKEVGEAAYSPLVIRNNSSLISLNINNLETVYGVCTPNYGIDISQNDLLTTYSISNLTTFDGDYIGSDCALNQATVDSILNQLANVVVLTNRVVGLEGGTNAAPSVTGATYVATLIGNGCTVTTN